MSQTDIQTTIRLESDPNAAFHSKRPREHILDPEEFSSDEESSSKGVALVRQDAKVGAELIQALGGSASQVSKSGYKICGRKMGGKNAGKKCQRPVASYGMCTNHWKKWKAENPWLKYPGHY